MPVSREYSLQRDGRNSGMKDAAIADTRGVKANSHKPDARVKQDAGLQTCRRENAETYLAI
jgi:hypothetical protein